MARSGWLVQQLKMHWHSVRLDAETYQRVKRMAEQRRVPMQDIVSRGIDAPERAEFARGFR